MNANMKKTISATVETISDEIVTLRSSDNKNITLPRIEGSDAVVGQKFWLTISTEEPNDSQEVLNTILGH